MEFMLDSFTMFYPHLYPHIPSDTINSHQLTMKWQCVKTLYPCSSHQNSWDLWMFIPLKKVSIGIDPYPNAKKNHLPNAPLSWGISVFFFSTPEAPGCISSQWWSRGIKLRRGDRSWINLTPKWVKKNAASHHKHGIFHGLFEKNLNMS